MDQKEQQKRSNLLKLEAMGLFTRLKAEMGSDRWPFFCEAQRQGYPLGLGQSISPYRASLHFSYVFRGALLDAKTHLPKGGETAVVTEVYLEREAHVGEFGQNLWTVSFSGIESKVHALMLVDQLQPLAARGFDIPYGNEKLERQITFSLGLVGSSLMHVDVHFPIDSEPFAAFLELMDHLEASNTLSPTDLRLAATPPDDPDDLDDLLIIGDWQTWK